MVVGSNKQHFYAEEFGTTYQTAMATNVTLISNTLVNKYLAYDGGNVAVHDFPTQNAGEFLIELLFPLLSLISRQERETGRLHMLI